MSIPKGCTMEGEECGHASTFILIGVPGWGMA